MTQITEAARSVDVCYDCDVLVLGGSCTGVFAAIRAARLGKKVALIESAGRLGGVAVNSMVNVWHSLWCEKEKTKIIGGLSVEVTDRLKKRGAVIDQGPTPYWQFCFNSNELCIELDEMIQEEKNIRVFLHSRLVAVHAEDGKIHAVSIEDVSGRRAITCKACVDASGNADLVRRAGGELRRHKTLQPPTAAAGVAGIGDLQIWDQLSQPESPLKNSFLWAAPVPGTKAVKNLFGTRVHGVSCDNADDLTHAEIEGRRQIRKIVDYLRKKNPEKDDIALVQLPSHIGVRETVHALCEYKLTEEDVLEGKHFEDAIAYGSYRVDIHKEGGEGVIFRYLDGREILATTDKETNNEGRWREEREVDPTYYQIPLRSLLPKGFKNLVVAGRCIDTDEGAHGGVRVMINCNQMGEAAGVACSLALDEGRTVSELDVNNIRENLIEGGSYFPTSEISLVGDS